MALTIAWGSILGKLLSSLGSSLFGYGLNRANNATLTGAQQEQNWFNAQQAQEQRSWSTSEREASQAFNSVEAEKNRAFQNQQAQNQMAFQRDMDNTLYQRRVADMQAAGINPALAVGGVSIGSTAGSAGAGSAASSSPGSGAAASGSNANFSMSDLMAAAKLNKEMDLIDAEIEHTNSDSIKNLANANLFNAQSEGQRLSNTWFTPLSEAQLDNLRSDLKSKHVQRQLASAHISESEANRALTAVQTIATRMSSEDKHQLDILSAKMAIAELGMMPERLKKLKTEIFAIYQSALTEQVSRGHLAVDTSRLLSEIGVLDAQQKGIEQENEIRQLKVNSKGLYNVLDIADKSVSIIGRGVSAAAGFYAGGKIGKLANTIKPLANLPWYQRSAYYNRP